MSLAPGTRLGPYEIQSALGAGGMGEVYRARDTKLHRDVALKVLPELHGADPERLARFRREAQVLASLNHPHIGAIYGLEDSGRSPVLVLELVEGPTLAERIAQGPLPLDEALAVARPIADALAAAHERGIVHRDLKPANVKLRPDGAVKVLDFGLAKALEPAPISAADAAQSPTITSPAMTQMGMILGTAAYMSPEQAKGRPADKRSDVWAFGCVLFEMLSGRRVFDAEDVADTLALVLTKEPAWALLPADTPPSIRRLLRRCLERDRNRRLADIADARLDLDEVAGDGAAPPITAAPPPPTRAALGRWLPWSLAAAFLATTLWLARTTVIERPSADGKVTRASLLLPPGRLGTARGGVTGANLALSPDGRRVALVVTDPAGRRQLWLRSLDGPAARPLPATEEGISPFWSPDSRWLAFVADGKLKKIDVAGGPALTLAESAVSGGSWSGEGVILFTQSDGFLAQVRATGGTPSAVTSFDRKTEGVYRHAAPFFLPDGRHFLYVALKWATVDAPTAFIGSLDSEKRIELPIQSISVQYAPGHLLFLRGSTLMAQPFDAGRLTLNGEALPVAEAVRVDTSVIRGSFFSVSATGALVFQEDPAPGFELAWYDRSGRRIGTLGGAADYADLTLSPDGRNALVSIADPPATANRDLWVFDVARGLPTRLTTDPAPETHNIWSPDGSRVAYDSRRKGIFNLYAKAANGAGEEELLLEDEFDNNPMSWAPDGRSILYLRREWPLFSLWVLPLDGDRKPFPYQPTPFNVVPAQFSPDGRWVVYSSSETHGPVGFGARFAEVFVSPFPGPGGKTRVSTAGGIDARWRRDGKEIFYLTPNNKLMAAAVTAAGERFEVQEVRELFDLPKVGARLTYDVTADGERILAVTLRADAGTGPLTLVTNWPALLAEGR